MRRLAIAREANMVSQDYLFMTLLLITFIAATFLWEGRHMWRHH
jgi:hypothetical protein